VSATRRVKAHPFVIFNLNHHQRQRRKFFFFSMSLTRAPLSEICGMENFIVAELIMQKNVDQLHV
jgi:hypothetical protein